VYRREKKKAHRTTLNLETKYYNRSKVQFTLEQATKAQRGSRSIALLLL